MQLTKDVAEELTLFRIKILIRSQHVNNARTALHLESQAKINLAEAQKFIKTGFTHDLMLGCTTVAIWDESCSTLIGEQPSVPVWRFIHGEDPKHVFAYVPCLLTFEHSTQLAAEKWDKDEARAGYVQCRPRLTRLG